MDYYYYTVFKSRIYIVVYKSLFKSIKFNYTRKNDLTQVDIVICKASIGFVLTVIYIVYRYIYF